jgi:uncharacterized protein (TIGR03083 family)
MSSTEDFTQVSSAFIEVVELIRPEQWSEPGLGSWNVRSLVGHTTRAILTVENYLNLEEPRRISVPTAENYYARVYAEYTDPASIAERGVEAGLWLGDDPVSVIRDARGRALALIDAQHPKRIVSIGGMGIPLDQYLRTRVFELVVHTLDIMQATGIERGLPDAAFANTVQLATAIAVEGGNGVRLLRALTGRGSLPDGFSVV